MIPEAKRSLPASFTSRKRDSSEWGSSSGKGWRPKNKEIIKNMQNLISTIIIIIFRIPSYGSVPRGPKTQMQLPQSLYQPG
jgi:hypothetical protein